MVLNESGQYAYIGRYEDGSRDEAYSRWIDRATLKYESYDLDEERKKTLKNSKGEFLKVERQCEVVSTKRIAIDIADDLRKLPNYKI